MTIQDLRSESVQDKEIISRAEAKARGLKKYYTGRECKNGHLDERDTPSGNCMACCRVRAREFTARQKRADPEAYAIKRNAQRKKYKQTELASAKKYRLNNRAKCLENNRRYHEENLEERRAYMRARAKARRQENPDEQRRKDREEYSNNKEKILARNKAYRTKNSDKLKKRSAEWRKNNKSIIKANKSKRRAALLQAAGSHTKSNIENLLKLQNGKCGYCRKKVKSNYHVDHITPLAKGGSNFPDNLQILCPECNMAKHDKDPLVFARERGLLL